MARAAVDGRALLRWIQLDLPDAPWGDGEPFVGLVFLDGDAGLSAKGGRASAPLDGRLTVRLPIGVPGRVLADDEAAARGLPVEPAWLAAAGPQPPRDAPWRDDPALLGRLHQRFPDDVQVVVAEGDPRRTGVRPEGCWVRIEGMEEGPPRPVRGGPASTRLYRAVLRSRPNALTWITTGGTLRFIADPGGRYPLAITGAYLGDRAGWELAPCTRCGLHEGYDPPEAMAAHAFPDLAAADRPRSFAARCPACAGTLELTRLS